MNKKLIQRENVLGILSKFDKRPKLVKDTIFVAKVSFGERPDSPFSDEMVDSFGLEIGNALTAYNAKFAEPQVDPKKTTFWNFYAIGEMADWFEKIELKKSYKLKLKCLFEIYNKFEFSQEGPIFHKEGVKGFLIISSE